MSAEELGAGTQRSPSLHTGPGTPLLCLAGREKLLQKKTPPWVTPPEGSSSAGIPEHTPEPDTRFWRGTGEEQPWVQQGSEGLMRGRRLEPPTLPLHPEQPLDYEQLLGSLGA